MAERSPPPGDAALDGPSGSSGRARTARLTAVVTLLLAAAPVWVLAGSRFPGFATEELFWRTHEIEHRHWPAVVVAGDDEGCLRGERVNIVRRQAGEVVVRVEEPCSLVSGLGNPTLEMIGLRYDAWALAPGTTSVPDEFFAGFGGNASLGVFCAPTARQLEGASMTFRRTFERAGRSTLHALHKSCSKPVAELRWQPEGGRLLATVAYEYANAYAPLACYLLVGGGVAAIDESMQTKGEFRFDVDAMMLGYGDDKPLVAIVIDEAGHAGTARCPTAWKNTWPPASDEMSPAPTPLPTPPPFEDLPLLDRERVDRLRNARFGPVKENPWLDDAPWIALGPGGRRGDGPPPADVFRRYGLRFSHDEQPGPTGRIWLARSGGGGVELVVHATVAEARGWFRDHLVDGRGYSVPILAGRLALPDAVFAYLDQGTGGEMLGLVRDNLHLEIYLPPALAWSLARDLSGWIGRLPPAVTAVPAIHLDAESIRRVGQLPLVCGRPHREIDEGLRQVNGATYPAVFLTAPGSGIFAPSDVQTVTVRGVVTRPGVEWVMVGAERVRVADGRFTTSVRFPGSELTVTVRLEERVAGGQGGQVDSVHVCRGVGGPGPTDR